MNRTPTVEARLKLLAHHTPAPAVDTTLLREHIEKRRKTTVVLRAISVLAAAVVLVIGAVIAAAAIAHHRIASIVTLEADGRIEIRLNSRDEVVDVVAMDQAGRRALSGYALDSDSVYNTLIRHMISSGGLDACNNTVLITAEAEDQDKASALSTETAEAITEAYRENSYDGAVLSQSEDKSDETARLAARYRISHGKAQLIHELITSDRTMSYQQLSRMNINDLNLIANSIGLRYRDIAVTGVSSTQGIISESEAIRTVELSLGDGDDKIEITARLDAQYGELIYRLSVRTGQVSYSYSLTASTGEIIAVIRRNGDSVEVLISRQSSTAHNTANDTIRYSGDGNTAVISFPATQAAQPTVAPTAITAPTTAPTTDAPPAVIPSAAPTSRETTPQAPSDMPTEPPEQRPPSAEQPTGHEESDTPSPTEPVTEAPTAPYTDAPGKTDPQPPAGVSFTSESYYRISADLLSAGYVLMTPPEGSRELSLDKGWFGLSMEDYSGEQKFVDGTAAVLCNPKQLQKFLADHNDAYTDDSSVPLDTARYDDSFFSTKALVVTAYNLDNIQYDFKLTALYTDGETLYADAFMSIPETTRAWNKTYHHLCIYEIDRAELKADNQLVLY